MDKCVTLSPQDKVRGTASYGLVVVVVGGGGGGAMVGSRGCMGAVSGVHRYLHINIKTAIKHVDEEPSIPVRLCDSCHPSSRWGSWHH